MTAKTTTNRAQLISSLKTAARKKGATPTGPDADKRRYGLLPKRHYMREFGTWNEAIEAAGLVPNEWKGRPKGLSNQTRPGVMPTTMGVEEFTTVIGQKLERKRMELTVLEDLQRELLGR